MEAELEWPVMFGMKSPIESAYRDAVSNRLFSMVYFALNQVLPQKERKHFRKEWSERGSFLLGELLLRCARLDWESYPETFWIDLWIAEHLRACEPGGLCYILDQWLEDQPLPSLVSEDPVVEDGKVRELKKLFAALNR